jgi:hypothetical protein
VACLAQGLLDSSQTRLGALRLSECTIGDVGMSRLADLVRVGHFEHLRTLNMRITDYVACNFARAIEESNGGMSKLRHVWLHNNCKLFTPVGRRILASVLTEHCPLINDLAYLYK